MHPKRRQPPPHFSLPDDRPQSVWTLERRHLEPGRADLESGVRVRASRARQSVLKGEFLRLAIVACPHTAGVEDLDGVHQGGNFEQIFKVPRPAAETVERMRDADERALGAQPADGLLRGEAGRDLFGHISGQEFAAGGHDLLANDDPLGVEGVGNQRPGDGVVVGDHEAVQPASPRGADERFGRGEGIFGGGSVGVEVDSRHVFSLDKEDFRSIY